jgi:hypothetical protein
MLKQQIPTIEDYRGVGIHDFQTSERIASVVKPAIDYLYTVSNPDVLFDYAGQITNPPEARLFAADLYTARNEQKMTDHEGRLGRLVELAAAIAGVASLGWADPAGYCSLLDTPLRPRGQPGIEPRPAEQRDRLIAAQRAAGTRA